MIYRMMSFSITLDDPNTDFKGTPLYIDVEYLRNGTRQTLTYTRPFRRCNCVTLSNVAKFQRHGASRGLSATTELLVNNEFRMAVRRDQSEE